MKPIFPFNAIDASESGSQVLRGDFGRRTRIMTDAVVNH
jgi:hypothetical protein